jgi:hypothetical protein
MRIKKHSGMDKEYWMKKNLVADGYSKKEIDEIMERPEYVERCLRCQMINNQPNCKCCDTCPGGML